jgi:energy-coupling factor transporter ATP-binding protein EcfA2
VNPTKKMPLFVITGASGVGKSTISKMLYENEKNYIVLESDILWDERFNTPEDNYRKYRELWMRLCANISQIGLPVVLCGCALPEQFEFCIERKYFTDIYYIGIICDEHILVSRMRDGRKITDEGWIKSSVEFNNWLRKNADKTSPLINLIDCSKITLDEAVEKVDVWIRNRIILT